jgi:small subunit ribosomal protein S12
LKKFILFKINTPRNYFRLTKIYNHLKTNKMPTFAQIARTLKRQNKKRSNRVPALSKKPQRKASCVKLFTTTPRKPNSALRKVARIKYRVVKKAKVVIKQTFAFIPGEGHNLKEHGVVLFRGGKTQDLPGMKYKLVRGKFDFKGLINRKNARSKYGTKKPSK